jgi:hypothetical protein
MAGLFSMSAARTHTSIRLSVCTCGADCDNTDSDAGDILLTASSKQQQSQFGASNRVCSNRTTFVHQINARSVISGMRFDKQQLL